MLILCVESNAAHHGDEVQAGLVSCIRYLGYSLFSRCHVDGPTNGTTENAAANVREQAFASVLVVGCCRRALDCICNGLGVLAMLGQ
jgi:hypothetical protein